MTKVTREELANAPARGKGTNQIYINPIVKYEIREQYHRYKQGGGELPLTQYINLMLAEKLGMLSD